MRAFVYLGGPIRPENIQEKPEVDDFVVCADSGYKNALALDVKRVDVLVGDMDSIGALQPPEGAEIVRVPAEKDDTDGMLAVNAAILRGATELVIIGGLGARLDHTMSNLGLLESVAKKVHYAYICDGQNRVRLLRNDSIIIPRSGYKYIGVLALDEKIRGVSIEGCKYPLKNATLYRNHQYAVSNEIVGNCTLINVRRGAAFIIESAD